MPFGIETYENAKKVLNRARAAVPTDPSIWITAAQLGAIGQPWLCVNML